MRSFKKVRCRDCGFLYPSTLPEDNCYRGEDIYSIRIEHLTKGVIGRIGTINDWHFCHLYHEKIPGLTPEQHLEHKLYKGPGVSLSRWALFWSIVAVLVSVGALIVSILKS
jgi:hypothetical protein